MKTPARARILAAAALASASTLAAPAPASPARAGATPVSPGARDEPVEIDGRCPTFSWSPAPASAGTELALYALEAPGAGTEARLLLHRRLPAGAGSYTLARVECLQPGGQYAWLVRPVVLEDAGSEPDLASWSGLLRFRVTARPSDTELIAAIDVVRRHLASMQSGSSLVGAALPGGSTLPPGSADAVGVGAQRGEESLTGLTGSVGVRGENVTATGDAVGVAGLTASAEGAGLAASNLGGGPDLRLIALTGADATMSESGILRSSPSPQNFEIGNPQGALTLTIDGVPAVTTATDQDTLGALACTSGQVAKWTGSAWQCAADADNDTQYAAGNQLELTGTTFDVVEGSGSGLDADTLDGLQASFFATTTHTHGLANFSTAVGELALDSNLSGWNNTAVGYGALVSNETGFGNTAVGTSSLAANIGGVSNTALGASALSFATGSGNTAVGYGALEINATGGGNTAVGVSSLKLSQSSSDNTAVGGGAMFENVNGSENTAVGASALKNNVSGQYNTAVGSDALVNNIQSASTAVGFQAMLFNLDGQFNTALGAEALRNNEAGTENTAVGYQALRANTASYNTAVGKSALATNTSGLANTALGSAALQKNMDGGSNTALGVGALRENQSGSGNTAVGVDAMIANIDAVDNTAVGLEALRSNETGDYNVAIGRYALFANESGNRNTALGSNALLGNTASGNTAVGTNALYSNTASDNTAVGNEALSGNRTGVGNVGVGEHVLYSNQTGERNTAVGARALYNNTSSRNTAIGEDALRLNTSGNGNVGVGEDTLYNNQTGSNNVAIGLAAGSATTGSENVLVAHVGVVGESGAIHIGTPGTHTKAFVAGVWGTSIAGSDYAVINSSGQLGSPTSSRRFKEEIAELGSVSDRLARLRPVSFRYTEAAAGPGERPVELGLVAEEVAEVLPELVVYDDEGRPYSVRYSQLAPLLLREVQQLRRDLEAQRSSRRTTCTPNEDR